MTSNDKLDRTEIYRIFADGERQQVELAARLQAIIEKLLSMGSEVEDKHTCRIVLHLGRREDVKADLQKRY